MVEEAVCEWLTMSLDSACCVPPLHCNTVLGHGAEDMCRTQAGRQAGEKAKQCCTVQYSTVQCRTVCDRGRQAYLTRARLHCRPGRAGETFQMRVPTGARRRMRGRIRAAQPELKVVTAGCWLLAAGGCRDVREHRGRGSFDMSLGLGLARQLLNQPVPCRRLVTRASY